MERIKRALKEAREEREKRLSLPPSVLGVFANEKGSGYARHLRLRNIMSFAGVIVAIVITITIYAWRAASIDLAGDTGTSPLSIQSNSLVSGSGDVQTRVPRNEELTKGLEFINARMQELSESVARLEEKILNMHALVDSVTASVAPEAGESSAAVTTDVEQGATLVTKESAMATFEVSPDVQVPAAAKGKGTWVVNLASLPSKDAADHFSARAQSRGVQVEQRRVTVQGKEYWRIQLTKFPTAKEARSYADLAKEKLGLKEVWIRQR